MDNATCAIPGCLKPGPYRRRFCGMHYFRWRTRGDAGGPESERKPLGSVICAVGDCGRTAVANGYCNRHNENLRLYGNPVPQRDRPLDARLRETGWTVTQAECWEWNGKRNDNGYGIFNAKHLGYVNARAHRVMYEHFTGPIPDGLILRHRCDNPPCVNPGHLIPGTDADNMADMVERGRHWMHGRTECPNGHDLTLPGTTREVTSHGRTWSICVECARDRNRRYTRSHPRATGRKPGKPGKLSAEQVTNLRFRRAAGESLRELAARFGISPQAVCGIAKGRSYREVPLPPN